VLKTGSYTPIFSVDTRQKKGDPQPNNLTGKDYTPVFDVVTSKGSDQIAYEKRFPAKIPKQSQQAKPKSTSVLLAKASRRQLNHLPDVDYVDAFASWGYSKGVVPFRCLLPSYNGYGSGGMFEEDDGASNHSECESDHGFLTIGCERTSE
jgi:hypothetical protein